MRQKIFFYSLLIVLHSFTAAAQVNENFSDGNFTENPIWVGNTPDWIVNAGGQLQSNNTVANNAFYLSTANTLATGAQWDFYVRLNLNTSSLNYTDVFLTASASDLTSSATTGYFVRIGNTDDEVALYRKDGATSTKIIDGVNGTTNSSDNILKIRVIRDAANVFTLFKDAGATGNFISEGSVTDASFTTSAFFGFLIRQSTSTFFQRHYFDDIIVQPYIPDVTPPAVQSAIATSTITVDVLFSEPVTVSSAQAVGNYSVNNGIGNPVSAQLDAGNNGLVHLTFANPFPNGTTNTLTVNNVKDIAGNTLNNGTANFSFSIAQRFDVVIDELMADPTPQVGLPNAEYIELKNVSGKDQNLTGWRIRSTSTSSAVFPTYILPADSFLIITSTGSAATFTSFGRVLGVAGFPALNNDGTTLSLISKDGNTIHAVQYITDWYRDAVKANGGWSLEMIDTKNPCAGINNWRASVDTKGGTPGKKNSIDKVNADTTPPGLLFAYSNGANIIILNFDEPLDSTSASVASNYNVSNGISVVSAQPIGPLFNSIQLNLGAALQAQTVYTVTVNAVTDCKGNAIGVRKQVQVGLPQDALANDVIINEILFNPRSGGFDYVEFYNRSNKIIDANKLTIANRNSLGALTSLKKLSETPRLILPGEYVVVTEDAANLNMQYFVQNPAAVLVLSSLPSFPDDAGTVVLLDAQNNVVDEVKFLDDWHFDLIANDEGVSLERIDPDGPSTNRNNFHSAASTAGYGTPGYKNSQYKQTAITNATIAITPKIFSPDNDGTDDIATIQYSVSQPGFVANITIFDASGRLVRHLVKNNTLGVTGSWNWDGLDEKGGKLPIGTYIIFTELFNLDGKKERFKNTIVLARRLN
ncbi:MAG: lamin tail domain-containing protein [Chitinophagaceae bacterium]